MNLHIEPLAGDRYIVRAVSGRYAGWRADIVPAPISATSARGVLHLVLRPPGSDGPVVCQRTYRTVSEAIYGLGQAFAVLALPVRGTA